MSSGDGYPSWHEESANLFARQRDEAMRELRMAKTLLEDAVRWIDAACKENPRLVAPSWAGALRDVN